MIPAGVARPHRQRRERALPSLAAALLAFIIPAAMFVEVEVVGRLFLSDLFCLALFPVLFFLKGGLLLKNRYVRGFLLLGGLYLASQVVTDLVRQSAFHDYSRGWAKISLTIVDFCSLYMLIDSRRWRMLAFAAGLVAGGLLVYFVNPGTYAASHPWKFGVGSSITLFVMIVAAFYYEKLPRNIIYLLLFAIGALNIYLGFRSLGGICFLTVAYLFLHARNGIGRLSTRKTLTLILVVMASGWLILEAYQFSASQGWLGEDAARLYERQSQGTFGILVGGRSELLVSARAILDSPLLGHGSWAKNWEYAELLYYIKSLHGYTTDGILESDLIPTHSLLLGGWVEAGLAGGIFWLWVLSLPTRVLIRQLAAKDPHLPLIVFLSLTLIWDILFSPFGATRRFVIPFYLIVMVDILARFKTPKIQAAHAHLNRHHLL